jgi:hypothetical protein
LYYSGQLLQFAQAAGVPAGETSSDMSNSATNHPRLLDVLLVEGIHEAAAAGQHDSVAQVVAGLQEVTLPGIVEYLCLRQAHGAGLNLPPLPIRATRSDVGDALQRVVCSFGLRRTGHFTPNTEINPEPAEFFVLHDDRDYTGHHYRLFETRWARACEAVGLRVSQSLMQLAMSAMTENAVLHAESAPGILVGYHMRGSAALFTVADLGRGVLSSLRENPQYRHLQHPREALRLALHPGVSSLGYGQNGFGFHQVFRALAGQYGTLRFRTGNVCVTMDGQEFGADLGWETYPAMLPGFQVTVCCRSQPPNGNRTIAL